jgi:iron complex outermembrane receptor protein
MKKYFVLALLSMLQLFSAHANNSIRGKITDAGNGAPVYGASVYISELKTGASTDTNGVFVILNVPLGTFLGEVRMIGYATQAVLLKAEVNDPAHQFINNISLLQTPAEYAPVIITGTSGAVERMRNPVPNTLQTRDHILKHGSTNAVSALTELPGISAVSTGNAIAKPVIRGLGYNRVVVLRNGIRQEGQQWGDEHGVEIDEFEIDRVEIIKGPGSIIYGSDAMAGVINFITPRTVQEGKISGEYTGTYQTNGMLFGNSLMTEGNIKGLSWQVRGSQKSAGNYFTPADGYVANSGFREYNASGFVGLNRHWGVSQISFSSFNQTLALPEGERDSLGNFLVPYAFDDTTAEEQSYTSNELKGYSHHLGIPQQRIAHNRVVFSNNLYFGKSSLKIDIGHQRNDRREFGNVLDPAEEELHMQLNTTNVNVAVYLPEKNGGQLIAGVNLQRQSNVNAGEEMIIPDYIAQDAGAFIHFRKITEKWYFGAGLRGDIRSLNTDDVYIDSAGNYTDDSNGSEVKFATISRTFSSFSAIAGASYQPQTPVVFRVNAARGFRVPNIAELSSNGRHEGTFRYEAGNAALKPETSVQLDLGMTYTSDHFNLELSVFGNDIQNFIYLSKLSSVSGGDSIADPADPAPVFTFVQGHARLFGGELFTDIHPHPLDWLHFENSVSFVQGELLAQPDSMSCLPFMPPLKYQSELNAHIEKQVGPFTETYFSAAVSVYFKQDRIYSAYGTETATPGYSLLEIGAGTQVVNKKGTTLCKIYFSANNLLNEKFQSHLSRLKYAPVNTATGAQGIFGQGRNFSVRLVIPFSFTGN